jgi:hypothetical protein
MSAISLHNFLLGRMMGGPVTTLVRWYGTHCTYPDQPGPVTPFYAVADAQLASRRRHNRTRPKQTRRQAEHVVSALCSQALVDKRAQKTKNI